MFKAKLIENEDYYGLRRNAFVFMAVLAIPSGLLINSFEIPIWITVITGVVYISLIWWGFKNQKLQQSLLGIKMIEADNKEVRIKGRKNNEQQIFELNAVDKITLKKEYGIPLDSVKEMTQEIKGHPKENFLIIHQNGEAHRFDFEVDSYYMITQLNKTADQWIEKGYKVDRTDS